MNRENLLKIALNEARRASGLTNDLRLDFKQRGSIIEWDEGVYKNTFEVVFKVWKSVALVDVELDANTGKVLSWYDKINNQEFGE